jgi:hypothetical protein
MFFVWSVGWQHLYGLFFLNKNIVHNNIVHIQIITKEDETDN